MGFVCFLVFVGGLNDIEDVIVDTWVGGLDLFDLFALSRLTTLIAISLEPPSTNENTVHFDSHSLSICTYERLSLSYSQSQSEQTSIEARNLHLVFMTAVIHLVDGTFSSPSCENARFSYCGN